MNNWVIVDTCVWASLFCKPSSPEKLAVDELLDVDRVALRVQFSERSCWDFAERISQTGWLPA